MLYLLYFGMPFLVSCLLQYALCRKFESAALRLIPVYAGALLAGVALLYLKTGAFAFLIGACGFEGLVLLVVAGCIFLGSGLGFLLSRGESV